jgi:hypothetical protein
VWCRGYLHSQQAPPGYLITAAHRQSRLTSPWLLAQNANLLTLLLAMNLMTLLMVMNLLTLLMVMNLMTLLLVMNLLTLLLVMNLLTLLNLT